MFFQRLDQRGLGEARWWLGEMLFGVHGEQFHGIAFLHRRQDAVRVVVGVVVAALLVHGDIAGLHQRGAIGAQQMALRAIGPREHVDGDRIEQRMRHLAGDRALPDQRVEFELVRIDLALDLRWQYRG